MRTLVILTVLLFAVPIFATVSDGESIRQSFVTNGSTTTFEFTFKCNSSDDVFVYSPVILTGLPIAPLVEDTDYTIAPTGGSYLNGGVVTIDPALEATVALRIVRRIKQSQETSAGAITPATIVAVLDKLTRQVQDAEDRKDRSLHIPDSDSVSFDMTIPNAIDRAGKNLGFDASGNATVTDSSGTFTSINAFYDDIITRSPWLDVRAIIASGTGTSGDPWILGDVSSFNNVFFFVGGFYQLSADWNILSDSHIWANKGVFLDPDTYTLECSGTISATLTDFTADGAKGAMSISVGSVSGFAADDWIEISASKDVYFEWATKTLPRELNQVVTTAANTLNLKYPLRREYDYDGGYTDNPTVTLITTLKENVVIENINIEGHLIFGYVNNLALRGITIEVLRFDQVVKSFEITNTEAISPVGTGVNRTVNLEGATEGVISIRTYGAKDGIRIWGCAEISGSMIVKQCDQRAIWIYGSDDIHLSPVNVLGTRTNTTNHEILLFDNCGFCSIRNAFVKETGKTGDNPSVVEFRAVRDWCEFTDSEVFCYSGIPVVLKPERIYAAIDRNKFYLVSGVIAVCGFDSGIAAVSDSVVKIRDNEVINAGDTGHMLRTKTAFTLTVDDIKYVEVSGNKLPVETNFLIRLSAGPTNTKGIETLVVTNNTVEVLTAGIGVGGIYGGPDLDFPVRTLIYNGNTKVQNVGLADEFDQVTNLITVDNTVVNILVYEGDVLTYENEVVTF